MKQIVLRGIPVFIHYKTIFLTIHKPQNGMFSISDKLYDYINQGYTLVVTIRNGHKQNITKDTKYAFRETVPTKYGGMQDWNRYWYKIEKDELGQMRMF